MLHLIKGTCFTGLFFKKWKKEGNVLFDNAINTFYLRLYGDRHMVKDHSNRKETRCCHIGYSFQLAARVLLYAPSHIPQPLLHPVMEHWLEQEIAQWVHPMKDRSDNPSHHERTLLPQSYILYAKLWNKKHIVTNKHIVFSIWKSELIC